MSSKLRLSSPEAIAAYMEIEKTLTGSNDEIDDIELHSKRVVSCWSKAGLDVYDDIILPFRSIESQPSSERVPASDNQETERNIRSVYKSASTEMMQFIASVRH